MVCLRATKQPDRGATTENPSLEVNPALCSRARVYLLKPLDEPATRRLLERALNHPQGLHTQADPEALEGSHGRCTQSLIGAGARGQFGRGAHPHRSSPHTSRCPVPLHLRNAPTGLMQQMDYGRGYAYYHDDPQGSFAQQYLPETVEGLELYQATGEGWEGRVRERLKALRARFASRK